MRHQLVVLVVVGCSSPSPPADPVAVAEPTAPASVPVRRSSPTARDPIAAWGLTASDGTGLRLVDVDAKVVIEGPLAFSELHLRFENPENRIREGTFAITLPVHAAVSRFAMEDNGKLIEAEVAPKMVARRAYDDGLHAGIDPAILEKAAGNQFTARVFPIPARAKKHLVISYSQELTADGYLLPLRGLPAIDKLSVALDTTEADGTHKTERMDEQHWQPDRDFVACVETTSAVANGALVAGAFEIASTATREPLTDVTLLVDTSASRALNFERYVSRVRDLVRELATRNGNVSLEVIAFDQEARSMYAGAASGFGDAQVAALIERGAAGASDLSRATSALAPRAQRRIVIVTDGLVTAGREGAELTAAFHALELERIDVVLAGGARDERIAPLTRAGKRPGDVFDLDHELASIAAGLGETVRLDVPIEVANATWVYPRSVPALRAGTSVMVFAKLAEPAFGEPTRTGVNEPARTFDVTIGSDHLAAPIARATPALLERAAARAQIDELEARLVATPASDAAAARKLRREIEKQSVAARVVSSQTAMIILESASDYARYGIDRNALTDILVVGDHGLELLHRTFVARKRTRGGGGEQHASLGMGYGVGHGAGSLRGRSASVPTVSIGQPMAMGSLDKNFIRRYMRRHIAKITYCYERQLLGHPALRGTVQTRFFIGHDGKVSAATATGVSPEVASCVADVIKHIDFPAGNDGTIEVHYPFTFRQAGDTDVPPSMDVAPSPQPAPPPSSVSSSQASQVSQAPPQPASPPQAAASSPASQASAASQAPQPSQPPQPPHTAPPPTPSTPDHPTFGPPIDALDGKLRDVTRAIAKRDTPRAITIAKQWLADKPTDVLGWVALGQAFEANHDAAAAARAYGSIIDLYASRAEIRRFAGQRLERSGERALAIDTYKRAVADRPDQITGHRLLAYALVRAGDHAAAYRAILAGADQEARADSYAGAPQVFAKDIRVIAAVYAAHGGPRAQIDKELAKRKLALSTTRSTRFILYWETDANDVDLHVTDAHGNHAFYGSRALASGGELYADVTTGFGPECFEIENQPTAGPYELGVHYYAQGPMGYGMGLLQIERFDGKNVTFEDRPFVIMRNQAYVALGRAR
jgi:tetratricopeptide (TPR) repeat protein